METPEYLILPAVRNTAARLATGTRYCLYACAGLALAEPLFLLSYQPMAGITCGLLSTLLLHVVFTLLTILAVWCHIVLLAERGSVITRWIVSVAAILAPLSPVCWVYTLCCGKLLLYRQAELPAILGVVLLLVAVVNIPRMAAAKWQLIARITVLPLLLLLIVGADAPGLVLACAALKLLAAFLASNPLHQLAAAAPRIISLPPSG